MHVFVPVGSCVKYMCMCTCTWGLRKVQGVVEGLHAEAGGARIRLIRGNDVPTAEGEPTFHEERKIAHL